MKKLCALLLFFFATLALAADNPSYKYQRLDKAKASFNLVTWSGTGGTPYKLSVENGVLHSTQPGASVY